MSAKDTIAAIATASGTGGIGIIRISGDNAKKIGEILTASDLVDKTIQFRQFYDARKQVLDYGICLYFVGPQSFTGEDIVEIQAHGSPILLDMLLERICQLGARLARAGEFSERAFTHGKLNLAQAEAIADLIEASSRAAAKAAMRSLQGSFSNQIYDLVGDIIHLRSHIEATFDFTDEAVDFITADKVINQLQDCQQKINQSLEKAAQGLILKEGLNVVLAGLPNAGKSSLLNYLAGYEAAIVTEIPGTTRDVLREHISLKGIPIRLYDTAGLHKTDNRVEQEGIKRAWQKISQADMILLLVDVKKGITAADRQIIEQLKRQAFNYKLIYSKADLRIESCQHEMEGLYISTHSGEGMNALIDTIAGGHLDYNQGEQTILARRRHIDALQRAAGSLEQAIRVFWDVGPGELMAEDLRIVQQYLGEITGEFTSEDLLGQIFSRFCIGK